MKPFYNSKNNYQLIVAETKKMKLFLGALMLFVSLNSNSQTATAPSGSGTLCDPYLIGSLDNLYWVSQNSSSWASGKYFVQTANIDASSTSSWNSGTGWSPIGNLSTRFYANYDGRGYTISNLFFNQTGSGIGFFGFTQSGTIKNMFFSNVSLTANITNVYGVGIVSAYSYLSTFTNCKITSSTFNTTGSQCYAGTMFGRMSNVTVSYCNSTANATHTNASAVHAPYGGLIGSLESGGGSITYSYATGNVSKSTGGNRTGGFIGIVEAGTVSKCYASGNVTTANQGGGFVGNSYTCTFSDCYAVGNVNSTASDGKGSFAGFAQSGTTFTRCYGAGALSGYVGGWSGGWSGYTTDATFNNCFFDQTTTGYSNAFGYSSNNTGSPTATTTANMKTQTTFSSAGWDFTSTWSIAGGVNNGYPTLIIPTVTISTTIPGCPAISTTGTTTSFSTCYGTPSSEQTISVSGANLSANITVSAPIGFEISLSSGSGYASSLNLAQSSGTVNATTIYLRLSGSTAGDLSGNISFSSTGAPTQSIALTGSTCYVWVGTNSTNWATASNWTSNSVLAANASISISASAVNHLVLDQNRTINDLSFNNALKNVDLGNYTLTLNSTTNANASNYIKTSGTGIVTTNLSNGETMNFPVGKSTYNPVRISNNSGAADNFSVNVMDTVEHNYYLETAIYVNRTWNISKINPNGGSGIDFVFNWNADNIQNGTLSTPLLNHYSGAWEIAAGTGISGGGSPVLSLTQTGYTGTFSPFAISDVNSALPIELVYFRSNCEGSATDIQWQTATEHNSSHFILEKSIDGVNWIEAAKYTAAGNSTTAIDYEFVDDSKLVRELVYYKLLQYDVDGKSAIYGPISSACQEVKEFEMVVAPNPNNGQFTLQMASEESQDVRMEVYNSNGLLVAFKTLSISEGIRMEYIDLGQLKPGIYNLQVQHSNGISNRKISIQ